MKCRDCGSEPAWHDFPAPDGWGVSFRGYPFEAWECPTHNTVTHKIVYARKELTTRACAGIITGEGYDDERQVALCGKKSRAVLELSGKPERINWPADQLVKVANGHVAPTKESMNDPARRREFMKRNQQFTEH